MQPLRGADRCNFQHMADDKVARLYWFPAKRYGWGWGLPRSWQGWAVLVAYVAVVLTGMALASHPVSVLVVAIATTALLVVCVKKGEPTRWRWGGR